MPSQEDYLDNLLRDMANKEQQEEQEQREQQEEKEQDSTLDLDSISDMSEDEIERLLSAGSQQEDNNLYGTSDMDLSDEDVLKMLEESDDSDLKGIQELLEKSARNEAVDDSIEDLLRADPEEEDLEAKILGESVPEDDFEDRKELLRTKRELKKEQAAAKKAENRAAKEAAKEIKAEKRAAKEAAKKAAKEAAKEAKTAEKATRKKSKEKKKKNVEREQTDSEEQQENIDDNLFDMSILDSIVSEADKMSSDNEDRNGMLDEDAVSEADNENENFSEPVDVFAQEIDEKPEGETDGEDETESQDFGIDLGSIFGGEDSDISLNGDEGGEQSDFPDFLALDADEADALIPNRDKKASDAEESPKKKKSFFSKILDFLTEEDDEAENENIKLSQENQKILNEIDSEEEKNKKGKKAKKTKPKKDKKEKPKKAPKPKKPPKPKKEKPPKEVPLFPEKKLSFKKVFPVILIGISVGVLLFVFVNSASDYSDKKEARAAYYSGDYQTCYQNLFGKELDETESIMFGTSESILYIRLWLREYEMFAEEGSEVEALDSLIQTVSDYPELYAYASQWNAEDEVAEGYAAILNILSNKYGLTENEALEIAAEPNDVKYTKIVTEIALGKSYKAGEESEDKESENLPEESEETMQDMLPEEEELGNDTFIDNRKDGEPEE